MKLISLYKLLPLAGLALCSIGADAQGVVVTTTDNQNHVFPALTENTTLTVTPATSADEAPTVIETMKAAGRFETALRLLSATQFEEWFLNFDDSTAILAPNDEAFAAWFERTGKTEATLNRYEKERLAAFMVSPFAGGERLFTPAFLQDCRDVWPNRAYAFVYPFSGNENADDLQHVPVDELPEGSEFGWEAVRSHHPGGIVMFPEMAASQPFFSPGVMKKYLLTKDDVAFLYPRAAGYDGSVLVGGAPIKATTFCKNGYLHEMSAVPDLPLDFAATVRRDERLSVMRSLLDRFSSPVATVMHDTNIDTVFVNDLSPLNSALAHGSGMPTCGITLFAPTDEAMLSYFTQGAGKILIERFNPALPADVPSLITALRRVPLEAVKPFVNELFVFNLAKTLPSRHGRLLAGNGARMFPADEFPDEAAYRNNVAEVKPTTQGAMFVVKRVPVLGSHSAVTYALDFDSAFTLVRSLVRADDNYQTQPANAPLRKYYSQAYSVTGRQFTMFFPSDDSLARQAVLDPVNFARQSAQKYKWSFKPERIAVSPAGMRLPVRADAFRYKATESLTQATGRPAGTSNANDQITSNSSSGYGRAKRALLIDLLEQGTITEAMQADKHFYTALNGAPVFVEHPVPADGNYGQVKGGLQIMLENDEHPGNESNVTARLTAETANGRLCTATHPLQPTVLGTIAALEQDPELSAFAALLRSDNALVRQLFTSASGEADEAAAGEWQLIDESAYAQPESPLLNFIGDSGFTLYAPTNEAVNAAHAKGLPRWSDIAAVVDAAETLGEAEKTLQLQKARQMVLVLVNFVKYHFQEGATYLDGIQSSARPATFALDVLTGGFMRLVGVETAPGRISVTDAAGQKQAVANAANLFVREMKTDVSATGQRGWARYVARSAYGVVHKIGKALAFDAALAEDYTKAWQ